MKKIFIILIICFQAFLSPVSAQLNPNNLIVYNELEGVLITDIITDKLGVVWIATNNGLVRYDGYEFKHYDQDPNDSKTIGSILTYKLFEGQNGHIWIGCTDLLCEYNPDTKTFKNYNLAKLTDFPKYERLDIYAINENSAGRIYFGAYAYYGSVASHSIFYKDKNKEQLQRFDSPNKVEIKNVYSATTDPLGTIWVFANNGFFSIDKNNTIHKEKWPLEKFLTNQYYSTIKSDAKGNIWMASSNTDYLTLIVWNPKTGKVKSYSYAQIMDKNSYLYNEMEFDKKGNLWVATNNGLLYFDIQNEQFQLLKENENQKKTNTGISCIHLDSFDNLWIGTPTQGLLRYTNKAEFKSFVYKKEDKNSITAGWVSKIFENKEDKVWMLSNNGLDEFDPIKNILTPYPFDVIMPEFSYGNAVGQYSDEEILIRTNKGHYLFDTNTKVYKKITLDAKLEKIPLTNLKMDSRGNQWYCTPYGAFIKIKNKKTLQHLDLEKLPGSNITTNLVNNIYDSSKFGLWLITDNGLFLYHYDTEKVERYGFDKNKGDVLKSQDINSLYIDKEGILWVGTWGGGLNKYNIKTGKIKYYSNKDGLHSMGIQGILPDEKNKALWLSTFEGISRFSISEEQFNNFSMDDGIQGRSFADGSYLKTSNGLMIFGGNNGITVFNPNDISKNSMPPKVFITDFKIGDYSIFIDNDSLVKNTINKENIELQYNQNNLSIDYLGIQYTDPAKNKFAYKLENYDDNWHEVGNMRTAYYYNLPSGDYTFTVKAANSNGVWNETGASISFHITPPWWRTWWAYAIYGLLVLAIVFYIDKFQRKRLIKKEHEMAKELELEHAREIEKAYHKLKETQSQLIQSEKMASLGELTAGIAHEIQNPLNFVNNFSEVSSELLDEMNDELNKGDIEEAKAISLDIKQNLDKINHHGKRADAIVKGMLQHSRSSSGKKELTDLNALCDEYLRLSYHGLRAKDKSFNASMKTDFDNEIGKINIIPQDFGRVVLNLLNNAFYAVTEKKNSGVEGYEPTVSIATKKINNTIEIKVSDNGIGIPKEIIDKVFQPFFTTKPTGKGTGLGLSLSYDIIKSLEGELKVESSTEGTTFTIFFKI